MRTAEQCATANVSTKTHSILMLHLLYSPHNGRRPLCSITNGTTPRRTVRYICDVLRLQNYYCFNFTVGRGNPELLSLVGM